MHTYLAATTADNMYSAGSRSKEMFPCVRAKFRTVTKKRNLSREHYVGM